MRPMSSPRPAAARPGPLGPGAPLPWSPARGAAAWRLAGGAAALVCLAALAAALPGTPARAACAAAALAVVALLARAAAGDPRGAAASPQVAVAAPPSSLGPAGPRGAAASPGEAAPLSQAALAQLRRIEAMGEEGFVAQLCLLFLEETRARLPRMAAALHRGDAAALAREAHTLRSGSAQVGALTLSELAGEIEAASRAGHLAPIPGCLDALGAQLPRVERALHRELAVP